ncbi:hypothetical protein JL193_09565 [Polaribacter batillariae]|uniref:Uncharacterized protein n=1 Tax=Polaribacter batillariae TaxID=2808900 RepID=A0ABX7SQB1_9FLAO|nr:hypothetical protein [Polaribacter batillariae]QTD36407.1 hypothetical protein JL193_09565 [Polaribacter batillariae]
MENNKNTFESILAIIGILYILGFVYHKLKNITSDTETKVISDDGLKAIQNPDTASQLREAVDDYHNTGDWNKTKLESIL